MAEDSNAIGILDRLLAFMDRPWKAVVIIVLIIICGAGYMVYLERAEIAGAILKREVKAKLNLEAFSITAPQLLRDLNAFGIVLTEINVADNIGVVRAGFDRDGAVWIPFPGPHIVISEQIDPALLVKFLRNEAFCFEISSGNKNPEVTVAARKYGVTYACMVAVPPIIGVLVGGLTVTWRERPDQIAEDQAKIQITQAALKYAVW